MAIALYLATENNDEYHALLHAAKISRLSITKDRAAAEVVLAAPTKVGDLTRFASMQWMQSTFAGVDALMRPDLRRDYVLTNVRGIFGQQMAEYVMGLGLHFHRQMPLYAALQGQRCWDPQPYTSISGKTLVLFGTGSIAQHLAGVAKAFGMRVVGINRRGQPPEEGCTNFDEISPVTDATSALKQVNWLVNTLPATEATRDLIGDALLSSCRNILLFNIGRGSVVDTSALLSALQNGAVQHAFLDVFEQEPLPTESDLWAHPSVTITPHIAAPSVPSDVISVFAENVERWQRGAPLKYVVDFDQGY